MLRLLEPLILLGLYYLFLFAAWGLLTARRSAPAGVLILAACSGALANLAREPAVHLVTLGGVTNPVDRATATLVNAAFLAAPLLLLLLLTPAGRSATLYDGLALGAFFGLGLTFTATLAAGPAMALLAWPPGAQGGTAGFAAWGALLGAGAVGSARLRPSPAAFLPLAGAVVLVLADGAAGVAPGVGVSVLLLVAGSWIVEDRWLKREGLPTLSREGDRPSGLLGEMRLLAGAGGASASVEVGRFLSGRRRLALLYRERDRGGPGPGGPSLAEVNALREKAEEALAGRVGPETRVRWAKFVAGQSAATLVPFLCLFGVGAVGVRLVAWTHRPFDYLVVAALLVSLLYPALFLARELFTRFTRRLGGGDG